MPNFIQLNLKDDRQKPETASAPAPEQRTEEQIAASKRLSRLVNKATHKAATHAGGGSGLFSK